MKRTLLIIFMLPIMAFAQQLTLNTEELLADSSNYVSFDDWIDTTAVYGYGLTEPDTSMFHICKERGHVKGDVVMSTLMYCPSYVLDTDSVSYMVYPNCNHTICVCLRCGQSFSEGGKETRVVIWRKEEKK